MGSRSEYPSRCLFSAVGTCLFISFSSVQNCIVPSIISNCVVGWCHSCSKCGAWSPVSMRWRRTSVLTISNSDLENICDLHWINFFA